MDEVSNGGINNTPFNNGTAPSLVYQINPTCLRCNNYGNADYDVRNYFSGSYVWQTPWKFRNSFVNGASGRLDDFGELLRPLRPALHACWTATPASATGGPTTVSTSPPS